MSKFKDSGKISSYATQAAILCTKSGLFEGNQRGELTPKSNFTRAESSVVMIRLLEMAELINKSK